MDANYRYSSYSSRPPVKKPSHTPIIITTVLVVLGVIVALTIIRREKASAPESNQMVSESQPAPVPSAEPVPEFNNAKLQQVLNDWTANHAGTYSVTLMDKSGKTLAEVDGHTQYFTASIYKLYVAYIGYQKVDDGTYGLSDPYVGGWTREKCLDEMIRTSHSPCAEKMWVELGKEYITQRMKDYGLTDTSLVGLTTSSHDAAIILARLENGGDLSEESRTKMLGSMLGQIYRDALPKGFTADVYDKVGFRDVVEYHDTGIVRLKDGRSMIVSVLTKSAGTKNIAGLASAIEAEL